MAELRLTSLDARHVDAVLALNEAAIPAVNSMTRPLLLELEAKSECLLTACLGARLAGFMLLLRAGVSYQSPNFLWFCRRYPDFLYVDRVVVAADARRRGVARAFYDDAWARASRLAVPLVCEVNIRPANPESMAFHRALGFAEVGRQDTEGGSKTVSLLSREQT